MSTAGQTLRCPQGDASDNPDWCDVCGLAMGSPPGFPDTGSSASAPSGARSGTPPRCAACDTELDGRFCEACGHDSLAPVPAGATAPEPTPAPPPVWRAVVRADRGWFDEVRRRNGTDAAPLEFPRYAADRRFELAGPQVAIGRRSAARGTAPEIDLTGLDPGVSAAHALLVARPDGGWELVDVGSTNGTTLAVADGPIPPHRPFPLTDGAVVHLGAWTTITITATATADP